MRYSIVLNREMPMGVQLNALGHVAVGLSHLAPKPQQSMRDFKDAAGAFVGLMSDDPLIVLAAANSDKLRKAFLSVRETDLITNTFVIDMKDGEPVDQEAAVLSKAPDGLLFVAVGCWGDGDDVRRAFRRFSLYG